MYYEEKVIDGLLMCRSNPKGEWRPVSLREMTRKLLEVQKELAALRVGVGS